MNYEIVNDISPVYHKALLHMIHRAFADHLNRGLRFTCSFYTIDDLRHKILSGYCFMALSEDKTILGISSFSHVNNRKESYENITCVSPEARGLGVASALYALGIKKIKSEGAKCVMADTAMEAHDSVRWHLQRCRCHKVGLRGSTDIVRGWEAWLLAKISCNNGIDKETFVPLHHGKEK